MKYLVKIPERNFVVSGYTLFEVGEAIFNRQQLEALGGRMIEIKDWDNGDEISVGILRTPAVFIGAAADGSCAIAQLITGAGDVAYVEVEWDDVHAASEAKENLI